MSARPVVFGEVLFDVFGDERILGGAPFNVAWHLAGFGADPLFVSSVGDDDAGVAVRTEMQRWGMQTDGLQVDPDHPTGEVNVTFVDGEPEYAIEPDRAYDFIDGAQIPSVDASLLVHGTLAARAETSRLALAALRERIDAPVFVDVNLRSPWWQTDHVEELIDGIDTLKLNEAELGLLVDRPITEVLVSVETLRRRLGVEYVVLTRGERGALCVHDGAPIRVVPPLKNPLVVDTVGAGDAFTAVVVLGRLRGWPLSRTLERAQQFASHVVGQRGAIVRERAPYDELINRWTH